SHKKNRPIEKFPGEKSEEAKDYAYFYAGPDIKRQSRRQSALDVNGVVIYFRSLSARYSFPLGAESTPSYGAPGAESTPGHGVPGAESTSGHGVP
ncbi:hypothetical protein L9F63_013145, partial [Diploptera punctata]